jgi:hypothetical protein
MLLCGAGAGFIVDESCCCSSEAKEERCTIEFLGIEWSLNQTDAYFFDD